MRPLAFATYQNFLAKLLPRYDGSLNTPRVEENQLLFSLPGFITALAYLLALLFGAQGILKLKDHVDGPSQTPLRVPLARFAIGGALLSIPIVYEAMEVAFNRGDDFVFSAGTLDAENALSNVSGMISSLFGKVGINNDVN